MPIPFTVTQDTSVVIDHPELVDLYGGSQEQKRQSVQVT